MLGRLVMGVMLVSAGFLLATPTVVATSGDDCPNAWGDFIGGGPYPTFNPANCNPLERQIEGCLCFATCEGGLIDDVTGLVKDVGDTNPRNP